jgi:YYY domain-containing protein
MLAALGLFVLIEAVGLVAAPLAGLLLGRLPGAGLALSKVLGLLLVTWLVWIAASLRVVGYGVPLIVGVLALLAVAGTLAALRLRALARRLERAERSGDERAARGRRRRVARLARLALPPDDHVRRRLFLGGEAVFAVAYAMGVLLASFAPDVWNTEKPMDMAFINAIDASSHFPPHDPWMSGETLNYYYLGHLALAWPIKLLGLRPDSGYLLCWGLLLALTASAVYAFAGTLWAAARATLERPSEAVTSARREAVRGGPVLAGLFAVALVVALGNLAGVRTWLRANDPPHDYAWFDPSRVIPNTINEFPSFSFLLGDLHAHVLALPFTVLALAFALQVALAGPRGDVVWRAVGEALVAGLAIGSLYAINSWSYPVVAGLLAAAMVVWLRDTASEGRRGFGVTWLVLVLVAGIVLILPFLLNFTPEARGVALVHERRPFTKWLGDTALIYGILLWPILAAFAGRLRALANPWRWAGWGLVAAAVAGSLLATSHLTGAMLLAGGVAAGIAAALSLSLSAPERFLWVLIAGGLALLFIPEVVYLRDAFDGTPLARMNTVFKAGYQAYLLLGLAAACALPWAGVWLSRAAWQPWALVASVLLLLGLVYPYAGSYARTNGFARSPSLDGLEWLRANNPGDPAAIAWLRDHTPGDAVVLEAFGDDYSAFGHGRISTFTGRATVLGWAGHELQWDHPAGTRADDVKSLYTSTDAAAARPLLARYGVGYVVVGPLEHTTYGDAGDAKWDRLGRRVLSQGGTTVWALR